MKCEVDYCIYNKDFFCIIKETQINPLGMCEECIIVSISADVLKELKERQLEEIESRWKVDKKVMTNLVEGSLNLSNGKPHHESSVPLKRTSYLF